MRVAALIIFTVLLWSCNEPDKQDNVAALKGTTDAIVKPKDTSSATFDDDSDDQELTAIVDGLKSEYNKTYNVDTTFARSRDTFRLIFSYKCLFDNGLLIPKKYVDIYGFNSFKTHNFAAKLLLYKNGSKKIDDKITKSKFANQIDESLKQYATLFYPDVKIEDSVIKVHFSISIPLTDVGVATAYIAQLNGQTYAKAD